MRITWIDPQTDPLWQKLVEQHPSSVFHSPRWMRVLAATYGFDVQAIVALDGEGEPIAGIPFCRIKDMTGERIVSLPFSDFCDPLVSDQHQWDCLIDALSVDHCPIAVRCLHNSLPLADERFTLVKQTRWHDIDLQQDLDALWHSLDEASRRAIRKAGRDGVVVRMAECEQTLRAFFELHLRIRKYKYHLLAQPYRFFQSIWRHFMAEDYGFLMVAEYQGEIIGGILFLAWKDTLYYKFNASNPAYLSHRPNDILMWEGIRHGRAKGYARLDLGVSDLDQEGLIRYKRKFATNEKTASFLRHPADWAPTLPEKEARDLLGQLTALFTDESVPDSITAQAGDVLYRFFA